MFIFQGQLRVLILETCYHRLSRLECETIAFEEIGSIHIVGDIAASCILGC